MAELLRKLRAEAEEVRRQLEAPTTYSTILE